jgi:hypothetical protein
MIKSLIEHKTVFSLIDELFQYSDVSGKIVVWDVTLMYHPLKDATMRDFSNRPNSVTAVALNQRQLFIGTKTVKVLDFWTVPTTTSITTKAEEATASTTSKKPETI